MNKKLLLSVILCLGLCKEVESSEVMEKVMNGMNVVSIVKTISCMKCPKYENDYEQNIEILARNFGPALLVTAQLSLLTCSLLKEDSSHIDFCGKCYPYKEIDKANNANLFISILNFM
ncbi:MAG: hypothetical protein WC747_03530 [Candidatus Babeliales bacterium]|jgi:hypothetical protein